MLQCMLGTTAEVTFYSILSALNLMQPIQMYKCTIKSMKSLKDGIEMKNVNLNELNSILKAHASV